MVNDEKAYDFIEKIKDRQEDPVGQAVQEIYPADRQLGGDEAV